MEKNTQIDTNSYAIFWKEGWTAFIKNWKKLLPITIVVVLVVVALGKIQEFVGPETVPALLVWIGSFIIQVFLSIGYINIAMHAYRGEEYSWKNMLEKSQKVLPYIGTSILVVLLMTAGFIPAIFVFVVFTSILKLGVFFTVLFTAIGFLLVILAMILVFSRLYFFQFFLIDGDLNIWDTIKATWRSAKGKQLQILILIIMAGIFNILGMLFFGVGLILTVPVTVLVFVSVYSYLSGKVAHSDSIVPEVQSPELVSGEDMVE